MLNYFFIFLILIIALIGFFFLLRSIVIILSLFTRAPYVPLERYLIKESVKFLNLSPWDSFVDIGSGDGRIVFWVAKNYPNLKSYRGIEINLFLHWISKILKYFLSNRSKIFLEKNDALKSNFEKENKVFVYLLQDFIGQLMPILEEKLPSGSVLVSPLFAIDSKYERSGNIEVKEVKFRGKIRKVYVWTKK